MGGTMEGPKILDSWKEISAYLNRSVMTCQRWEKQLDLPVHRLDGTPKARVFAYPEELDRWRAEMLHSHETQTEVLRTRSRRIWRGVLMTASALALLGAFGILFWRLVLHPAVPVPAKVPSLVVLPFANDTGDAAWDAWRLALPDLLTIDLRQSKFLDVIKTTSLFQAVGPLAEADDLSPDDLKAVADRTGVEYVLSGNLQKAGRKVVLAGSVRNIRTGKTVGSTRAVCQTENEIFAGVDDLSKSVRVALKLTPRQIRGDIDRPVVRISTGSPEAFRLYSQAYRVQGKSKFDQAIAPLLKAVEIDPQFGLAYRILFFACRAMDRTEDAKKYGPIAVGLADRIEERERYLFLSDFFESETRNGAKSLEAYLKLGAHYPYDLTMLGLAQYYKGREEWGKAVPVLEKLLLRYPRRTAVLQMLLDCYGSVGRYSEAEKLIDDRLGPDPQPGNVTNALLGIRYDLALSQKRFEVAHDTAERMKAGSPNVASYFSNKGFVYFMQDDLANAEKLYSQIAAREDIPSQRDGSAYLAAVSLSRGQINEARQRILRAIGLAQRRTEYEAPMEKSYRRILAYLERAAGRLPEALREVDAAYAAGPNDGLVFVVQVLYLKALITVEMNRFDEFEKQVEEIRRYLDPDRFPFGAARYMRVYYNLLGHRELQKAHYEAAIQYFWKALDLLSPLAGGSIDGDHAQYYFDLAEAYRRSGNSFTAVPIYEKVILPTVSREYSGDLYAKSFYWMGVDSEMRMRVASAPDPARERRQEAIAHYRKFLSLWGDADPVFPEVEDAGKRLAGLVAMTGTLPASK
jgi:tetratricopeptide (TPR) repeat protein